MKRIIKKVAVVGSGIMGSGIACHFANIGLEVLLLDIVPNALTEIEEKKGGPVKKWTVDLKNAPGKHQIIFRILQRGRTWQGRLHLHYA